MLSTMAGVILLLAGLPLKHVSRRHPSLALSASDDGEISWRARLWTLNFRGAINMVSEALQHLSKGLEDLIEHFRNESERHKRVYRKLRYVAFAFTGCSTVMSSLALNFKDAQPWLNIGVVLATVAVGVATSIEGLQKPSELWIQERNVFHALQDLKTGLRFQGH
jgi:hypothetical protein